jgi:glycerol-3-phosphate dehydrogenase subunit B
MDFLNALPNGERVYKPEAALEKLKELAPEHPYSLMGAEKTKAMALEAERLLNNWGILVSGSFTEGNHLRLSPMGKLLPTWLSQKDVFWVKGDEKPLWEWKKVSIVTVKDFLDFSPEIISAQLNDLGLQTKISSFTLPDLEILRENPSEFRSVNIARVLDKKENRPLVLAELKKATDCDALILPACLGLNHPSFISELSKELGIPVRIVPTLAPSMVGARINNHLHREFLARGGVSMPKDVATAYTFKDPDAETLTIEKIFTANHGDIPIRPRHVILATGSFFSKGLYADMGKIKEAVFELDLLDYPDQREEWTKYDFFAPQPYAGFGVKVDENMRTFKKGKLVTNLKAAGLVLGGFNPVLQGCGAGVALVTALVAAQSVLAEE